MLVLAQCRGQIITILNNDLVFPTNWFDGIVNTLESNSSIGVAVPFLTYGSGPEHLGIAFSFIRRDERVRKKVYETKTKVSLYLLNG